MSVLLVALGAAVGAPARLAVSRALDRTTHWGTLLVNLLGSAVLGWLVGQGAGFVLQQHRDSVAHRVGQPRAARDEFLSLAVIRQRAFGDGADQQFKQFGVHGEGAFREGSFRQGQMIAAASCLLGWD